MLLSMLEGEDYLFEENIMLMQQATCSTGRLESRWLTPWWNQLRTWRSIPSLSYSLHPFLFASFHFHFLYPLTGTPCCLSLIPFSHIHLLTRPHTPSSLASVSTRSTIKCECLQLILNYFKLFLLLPSEEVRNLSPPPISCANPKSPYILYKPKFPYILCKPKTPHILCKPKVPYLLRKPKARPNLETALFLPLVVQNLSCPIYVSPVIQALQCTLQNQSDTFENFEHQCPPGEAVTSVTSQPSLCTQSKINNKDFLVWISCMICLL